MARKYKARTSGQYEVDSGDKAIIQEAKDRYKKASDWETNFVELYNDDQKFYWGDSDNNWQWPDDSRRDREKNRRPSLTINETKRHVKLITNDMRQNKPSISIKPTGEEASFESAQVFEGVVRDIEYKSRANDIYTEAMMSQVIGGIGYWRVNTIYPDVDSFDQEIRIEPVRNHLCVKLDCDIKTKSGLDALYGFIFDDIPRKEFATLYPNVDEQMLSQNTGLTDSDDWIRQDYVRVAEYYRIVQKDDELYWVETVNPQNQQLETTTFRASEAPKNFKDSLVAGHYKKRKVMTRNLEWYKIAGNMIIDRRCEGHEPMKGQYIPIVRIVGEESQVEGKLVRCGFVRALKDVQRGINFNISAEVESAAMATKTKWVGAAAAFEGNEVAWNNMNINNAPWLPFKHLDSDGNPLPPQALPQRVDPAAGTPAYLTAIQLFSSKMESITGQYAAQLGAPSNEKSGKAIAERQRQGDVSNYDYIDNQAVAITATGQIIIDLFRHIYDTKRVSQILGKDGTQSVVTLDPEAPDAYSSVTEEGIERVIFNPGVGKYEVQADVGPNYSTQRQEAYNAFVQIVSGAPDLIGKIGDLMFRSADFPLADKIAERLRRDIETNAPYLLKDGLPSPQMQAMSQQLEIAQKEVGELISKLAEKQLELKDKSEDHRIRDYEAQGKRLTAETNSIVDMYNSGMASMEELLQTIMQTLTQMQSSGTTGPSGVPVPPVPTGIKQDMSESEAIEGDKSALGTAPNDEKEEPPMKGATRGEDGNWYVHKDGKKFVVMPHVSSDAQ